MALRAWNAAQLFKSERTKMSSEPCDTDSRGRRARFEPYASFQISGLNVADGMIGTELATYHAEQGVRI